MISTSQLSGLEQREQPWRCLSSLDPAVSAERRGERAVCLIISETREQCGGSFARVAMVSNPAEMEGCGGGLGKGRETDTMTVPRSWIPKCPEGGEQTGGGENTSTFFVMVRDLALSSEGSTGCFPYPYGWAQAWQLPGERGGKTSNPGWG